MVRSLIFYLVSTIVLTVNCMLTSAFAQGGADRPLKVTGEFGYTGSIVPKFFAEGSTAALLCVDVASLSSSGRWVSKSEQIIGRFTTPIGPPPLKFEVDLPIHPNCPHVDIDNNGQKDRGVQILAAVNAINIFGDSYLEQLEQESGYYSILPDGGANTGLKGTLLIYAPDGSQKVPAGFGKDKRLFTTDDPTVRVPAGYSLMRINADRTISFDHTSILKMDILQAEASADPDFSSKGILGSFDALLDLLKERYAYTALRQIDWEKKRGEFRPRFADAEKRQDLQDYYSALFDLANSMRDGHVGTMTYNPAYAGKRLQMIVKQYGGTLGAQVIRYSDGRFMIVSVGKDSPAEKAGLALGTEVVKIDGKSALDHALSLPQMGFFGTDEGRLRIATQNLLSFPIGESVAIEYRLRGETSSRTATLGAGDYHAGGGLPDTSTQLPIELKRVGEGKFGYFRWANFENVRLDIAGYETFLQASHSDKGIILDLRGNSGGLMTLMYSMASYLFPPEKKVSVDWLDTYLYNDLKRDFVAPPRTPGSARMIYSPREDLTFAGDVVILVDGNSASAAEFLSQFLQRQGRAVVIADSGTNGAGGTVRSVTMPGNIPFLYTAGRTYFAGTQDVNLEGKGVTPDIRVPVDDEYVRRRLKGEDVVLTTAIKFLSERSTANSKQ